MSTGINYSNLLRLIQEAGTTNIDGNNNNSSSDFDAKKFFELGSMLNGSSETIQNPNNQKNEKIKFTISKLLSMFTGIRNQETNNANKEIKQNTKKITKLQTAENNAKNVLINTIQNIKSSIGEENNIVKDATKEIEETNKKLEEKQNEIEKITEKILKEQEALAKATSPEEQTTILTNIKNLSSEINLTLESIEELEKNVMDSNKNVLESSKRIKESNEKANAVTEENEAKIAQFTQIAGNIIKEAATSQIKGQTNVIAGEAAQQAAQASNTNVFTGNTIGKKLQQVAIDQKSGGTTRIQGSFTNLKNIMQGLGNIEDTFSILTEFKSSVGSSIAEFDTHIGNWETVLEPVIEGFGSFNTIKQGNDELQETATNDLKSLSNITNTNEEAEMSTEKQEKTKSTTKNTVNISNTNESNKENTNLLTLEFDVNEKLNLFAKN